MLLGHEGCAIGPELVSQSVQKWSGSSQFWSRAAGNEHQSWSRKRQNACSFGLIGPQFLGALEPFLQVLRKTYPGTRRSRKVRGRSAEARKSTLDPDPCLCFRNPFFSPMGNPNELLLVRPHVAATSQLHSYGNDSLSLWPRVASNSQLARHENLCMNVTAFLKTCHPSA